MGLACGDALGNPTEFLLSLEDIESVFPGGIKDLPEKPIYTDDTQMTLAVANALLGLEVDDIDKFMDGLSVAFVKWLESQSVPENRRAPGNTCLAACELLAAGNHWSVSGIAGSCGCGSAMRSAPIGIVFEDIGIITDYALASSKITHGHELALCGAATTAILTRYALDGMPIGCWGNELLKIISINAHFKEMIRVAIQMAAERRQPDFVLSKECLGEGWTGHEAVASSLYCCLMNQDSYRDAVVMAANTVGDSDSIACITGAIMGARLGEEALPQDWASRIENATLLRDTADKLADKSVTLRQIGSVSSGAQILVRPA